MFRRIVQDALFRAVQFGQIMNGGQRMFSGWRCLEMQVAQYRRKKALYPPVLLHHFVMEIVVLRPGQLIYLADGFCQPAFRYAVEYGLPQFSIVSLFIQQQ
jgi:hypothetical protein|uniref:Uncharacterized protein n=2 Tax=Gammaproteobacteria TaxID=1236 RepID=B0RKV7_YEREN|nr:hypothetical protein [Yersinia enterocolitica]